MDSLTVSFTPSGKARTEGVRLAMRYLQKRAGMSSGLLDPVLIVVGALLLALFSRRIVDFFAAIHPLAVWVPLLLLVGAWAGYLIYCRKRLGRIYDRLAKNGVLMPVTFHLTDEGMRTESNGSVTQIPFASVDAAFKSKHAINLILQDGLVNVPLSAFDSESTASEIMDIVLQRMRPEARERSAAIFR